MIDDIIDVRGVEEVEQFICSLGDKGVEIITDELYKTVIDIRNDILKSMRNTIKESRGAMKFNSNGKALKKQRIRMVSSPGYPPAIQSGNLSSRIIPVRGEGYAQLYVDNVIYAKYLEEGTKKMAARPYFEPAVMRSNYEQRIINRIIAERFNGRSISE